MPLSNYCPPCVSYSTPTMPPRSLLPATSTFSPRRPNLRSKRWLRTSATTRQNFVRLPSKATLKYVFPSSPSPSVDRPTLLAGRRLTPVMFVYMCVQFNPDIVQKVIDRRSSLGLFTPEMTKEARERAERRDDGRGRLGKAIWKCLLEKPF
jgi:hypothetical protein